MSIPIMPSLPLSMAKGLKKWMNTNTVVQSTQTGYSSAFAMKPFPTWDFEFSLDNITGNEATLTSVVAKFQGVYAQCLGRASLFLFTDPQDNTVTTTTSGMLNNNPSAAGYMSTATGDGSTISFQLVRSLGGVAWDIIQNLNGSPSLYVNGTLKAAGTDYSVSSKGVVTFTVAPANGATLTWSGNFYFACRFAEDTVDAVRSFTINSGTDQWIVSGVKFSSEFLP